MYEAYLIPMLLSLGLPAILVVLALVGMLSYRTHKALRRQIDFTTSLVERLEATERKSHAAVESRSDQARRIAWLETRVRQKKESPERTVGSQPEDRAEWQDDTTPRRNSMVEQRHRVLALARRGLDIHTIADTLCLPHGEVELILALQAT